MALSTFELDLACLLIRLRQIRSEDGSVLGEALLLRVLECDLPRMELHCSPEVWLAICDAEQT